MGDTGLEQQAGTTGETRFQAVGAAISDAKSSGDDSDRTAAALVKMIGRLTADDRTALLVALDPNRKRL